MSGIDDNLSESTLQPTKNLGGTVNDTLDDDDNTSTEASVNEDNVVAIVAKERERKRKRKRKSWKRRRTNLLIREKR